MNLLVQKPSLLPCLFAAGILHTMALAVLVMKPATNAAIEASVFHFRMAAAPEAAQPLYMFSAVPVPANAPDPGDEPVEIEKPMRPTDAPPRPAGLDEAALQELAAERELLRSQINQERKLASLPEIPRPAEPEKRAPASQGRKGNPGTIRELDFSGWPESVVDEVMGRYRLRVVTKVITGPISNNFLSSAADQAGDRYFSSSKTPPGVYEVFELSRDAVSKMSYSEEEAIIKRGLTPATTHVSHIKFGIVTGPDGAPDLGVLSMEAEPI